MFTFDRISMTTRRLAVPPLVLVLALAGCSGTVKPKQQARIEIQEEVGFVITEEARVTSAARADYEEGVRLLEQGEHRRGVELLAKVVEEAPELSAPRIDLGIAWHRSGNLEAAEEQLRHALETNPDHPVVHNELGIVQRKSGRFAEARASYEAALAIYPGFHFARRNLAVLCDLYLADLACARDQYSAYLETAPGDAEAEMWLADVRNRLGE